MSDDKRWFVVVWEGDEPVRVYDWDNWIRIPVSSRDLDNNMVIASDELAAFIKAKTQPRDVWMEWIKD